MKSLLLAVMLIIVCANAAFSQLPLMAVVSPEVMADRAVTFRLLAPNVKEGH